MNGIEINLEHLQPKHDGGPALPAIVKEYDDEDPYHVPGLSKFEYYAAHAPAEIPDWFEPKTDPKPERYEANWAEALGSHSEAFNSFANKRDDGRHGSIEPFCKANNLKIPTAIKKELETDKEATEWVNNRAIQRYFQWRWYYAKMMIEATN